MTSTMMNRDEGQCFSTQMEIFVVISMTLALSLMPQSLTDLGTNAAAYTTRPNQIEKQKRNAKARKVGEEKVWEIQSLRARVPQV